MPFSWVKFPPSGAGLPLFPYIDLPFAVSWGSRVVTWWKRNLANLVEMQAQVPFKTGISSGKLGVIASAAYRRWLKYSLYTWFDVTRFLRQFSLASGSAVFLGFQTGKPIRVDVNGVQEGLYHLLRISMDQWGQTARVPFTRYDWKMLGRQVEYAIGFMNGIFAYIYGKCR